MKKIIIALAALATVAACNKAEVIENTQDNLITFNSPFVDYATKAADNTYSGTKELTSFNVYGTVTGEDGTVNIFNGVQVTGTVGAAEWAYDAAYAQYWIPGADYSFAAVVDANGVTQDATYKMPTALTYATAGQKDLLYATAVVDDATAAQGVVNLTFAHLLSKAHFTVTSNATGDYSHNVTNIKVNNFETGTYTIAGGTWAGTTATDISFGDIKEVTASATKTNATQMLLIPNADDFTVSFTVEIWNGATKLGTQNYTKTVSQDLVKGNAYNFTIECSVGNPIKFTVSTDPAWTPATPDVTIQ